MSRLSYETICNRFAEKNCKVLTSKSDWHDENMTTKSRLNIKSSCGHEATVSVTNFQSHGTGIFCLTCTRKDQIDNGKTRDINDGYNIEAEGIKMIQKIIASSFDISVMREGTLADIAIRLHTTNQDQWLPIQLKITKSLNAKHQCYYFKLRHDYPNMLVLFMCIDDGKAWLVPGNEMLKVRTITTKLNGTRSKLAKYKTDLQEISQKLEGVYNDIKVPKHKLKRCNIAIGVTMRQEQDFSELRMTNLSFISQNAGINNDVTDFLINKTIKVQEKVASVILRNGKESGKFRAAVCRCANTMKTARLYQQNDNDYYWIHIPDRNHFYVIPEQRMIEEGWISLKHERVKRQLVISFFPTHDKIKLQKSQMKNKWLNDYLFSYSELDKKKLMTLLKI